MSVESDRLALKVAETMLSREGSGPAWGIRIDAMAAGSARLSMRVRADMLNGNGTCHGGMIFALADTAFAYACNSRNVLSVAQHAAISFLAPAKEGDLLIAEAREEGVAGRSGTYTVRVSQEGGAVIAVFQGLSRAIGGVVVGEG